MNSKCLVCERIPPQDVFKFAHEIFSEEPRKEIHHLAVKAIKYINYVDKKNRIFFCGRSKYQLLASLFYLLNLERIGRFLQGACVSAPKHYSMNMICWCFPSFSKSSPTCEHITEAAMRNNKNRWLQSFPHLFPFNKYTAKGKIHSYVYWRAINEHEKET